MDHYGAVLGERVGGMMHHLRETLPSVTIPDWSNELLPSCTPDIIHSRASGVKLPVLVGATVLVSELPSAPKGNTVNAYCIASYRNQAPLLAGALHGLAAAAESPGGPLTAIRVWGLLMAPWSDRYCRWRWEGWDAATGEPVVPTGQWATRTSWDARPRDGVELGARFLGGLAGVLLRASPGNWTVEQPMPLHGELRSVVTEDGVRVGHFFRPEDAAFVVLAREAMSVLGGAFTAVASMCGDNPESLIEPDRILDAIVHSTPLPLTRESHGGDEKIEGTLPR